MAINVIGRVPFLAKTVASAGKITIMGVLRSQVSTPVTALKVGADRSVKAIAAVIQTVSTAVSARFRMALVSANLALRVTRVSYPVPFCAKMEASAA
jgi:hypothetical protein